MDVHFIFHDKIQILNVMSFSVVLIKLIKIKRS